MEHIAALLLVIGCSNGMTDCRELSVPVSVFETFEECTAERPFALDGLRSKAQHVIGECLAVDPALEDDYDQIAWNVRPDGTLEASLQIAGTLIAANGPRPEKDYLHQQ
ncbi:MULTISPECIES: hypothetical protein [unclassified Mesorhizobium]|uniref:hypothetical protein n=1 Tax=unclassified Mesorhizobium TaxID=325217 RepID=UPI000BB00751|nr:MULTISPECIES: hypothetical protein [unclassified Mesorhizobium]TGT64000.1 hypothetical protein EN813_009875 [Mesorhizobium sp. M00.F.Ca.ET.170.01.1.1]AZO11241.1 hypothetical protein EJ074_20705 [Mesorhizobium sp. M3A.F.Ca.ET.080.04.2.1]PBB88870.1 hypothetical protein CK216_01915 [Mesorhizobium sp. WSM3876]RWB76559.1 MAG: hypothetical protein EOQ49_01720 [Mesorhizobium sp.]RWB92265.1 MAG: hypothetical protein EOQ52_01810 [Mesorhizobium sp.]